MPPLRDHRTTHEIMHVLDDYPSIEAPMHGDGRAVQPHRPKRGLQIECHCPIPSRRIQRLRLIGRDPGHAGRIDAVVSSWSVMYRSGSEGRFREGRRQGSS